MRLLAAFAFLLLLSNTAFAQGQKPTEDEIRSTLQKFFVDLYMDKTADITNVQVEFGPITIGSPSPREVKNYIVVKETWPVKTSATITQFQGRKIYRKFIRGTGGQVFQNEGFVLYRNEFGEWQFVTANF